MFVFGEIHWHLLISSFLLMLQQLSHPKENQRRKEREGGVGGEKLSKVSLINELKALLRDKKSLGSESFSFEEGKFYCNFFGGGGAGFSLPKDKFKNFFFDILNLELSRKSYNYWMWRISNVFTHSYTATPRWKQLK